MEWLMGIVISMAYLRGAPYVLVSIVLKYLFLVSLGAVQLYERAHIRDWCQVLGMAA